MKKKLLGFGALALLASLTLASCGGGSRLNIPKLEYDNKLTKGNSVDSINVEVADYDTNSYKTITISKNDKYEDMIRKLNNYTFGVNSTSDGYMPFGETYRRDYVNESINIPTNKVVKNEDGSIEDLIEYTTGNVKTTYLSAANTISYINSGSERLYIGNKADSRKSEYNLASGNVSQEALEENFNKGTYFNYQGDVREGGSIEYATDREYSSVPFRNTYETKDTLNLLKNYGSLYYKGTFEAGDPTRETNASYKAKDYDINFNVNRISDYANITQTSYYITDYAGASCNIANVYYGDMNMISEAAKKYYDLSFELTDKYLIIKNKINMANQALMEINETPYYEESRINQLLNLYNGSYTYKEVWVDYKNALKSLDTNRVRITYGYAYYKMDEVIKTHSTYTWKDDGMSYISGDDLRKLGMIGKTSTYNGSSEVHWETYLIDISKDVINNKKTEFINKCKNDNFLEKYEFQKVTN